MSEPTWTALIAERLEHDHAQSQDWLTARIGGTSPTSWPSAAPPPFKDPK